MTYYDDVYRGSPEDPKEPTKDELAQALHTLMMRSDVEAAFIAYDCELNYEDWVELYYNDEIKELAYELANR